MVSVLSASNVAFDKVFEYVCPLTAAPEQSLLSCSSIVSVPFSGVNPLPEEAVAESLGTQVWPLTTADVSVTVIVSVLIVPSGQAVGPAPLVFGESPV